MRVKLSVKYQNEREDICNRLIHILELDENHSILLCDLEKDVEKQTKILGMKDEIKKYFAVSCLSPYKPNATCKRPYINILRGILRTQGYTFEGCNISLKNNENQIMRSMKYIIFRDK